MTVEKEINQEEKANTKAKLEKIKLAIWIYNRLIDKNPEQYKAWREIYDKSRDSKGI